MAASGVLSSWLMLATNCDLCWLAISSSRLFWAISSNRRAFSSAIADWSAKLCIRLTTACGELARAASPQDERAERPLRAKQWDDERCAKPRFKHGVAQGLARTLGKVWNLQWLSLGNRLAEARLFRRNVKLAEPCNDLLVEPRCLAELEGPGLLAIVEYRASIGAREMDGTVDNGLQHHLQIERRAYRSPDFAQSLKLLHRAGKLARAHLNFVEQPGVLDGDDGLVGEGLQQLDLRVAEWAGSLAHHMNRADGDAFAQHRRDRHSAEADHSPAVARETRCIGCLGIADADHCPVQNRAPGGAVPLQRNEEIAARIGGSGGCLAADPVTFPQHDGDVRNAE